MIINETPIRTSKNYGINSFEIPNEILNVGISKKSNFSLQNFDDCIVENKVLDLPQKPLSEKLNEEFQKANLILNIKINNKNKNYRVLNVDLNKKTVAKIKFEVEKNVNSKIIIKINSKNSSISNCFVKFVCCENSSLDVNFVCNCENANCYLLSLENEVAENAKLNYTFVDFSAKYSVVNFYSRVNKNAECNFKNSYIACLNSSIDLNIYQDLFGENSVAKNETVGALLGESKKSYKGTIKFNRGAKKSVGEENELCMLLSNSARSKALPMLLCDEEEVFGSHSTAIGKVDKKELFYLMSRGFTENEAIKLLIKAKLNSTLSDVEESLKTEILEKIDRKIDDEKL